MCRPSRYPGRGHNWSTYVLCLNCILFSGKRFQMLGRNKPTSTRITVKQNFSFAFLRLNLQALQLSVNSLNPSINLKSQVTFKLPMQAVYYHSTKLLSPFKVEIFTQSKTWPLLFYQHHHSTMMKVLN
jgi:hypothetical protein